MYHELDGTADVYTPLQDTITVFSWKD